MGSLDKKTDFCGSELSARNNDVVVSTGWP